LVYYYEQTYNAEIEASELSDERKTEIGEHWRRGNLEVKKATNIGAFMISLEAENALKQYWEESKEEHDPGDWVWHLEHDYVSAEKCLKQLVACAKSDLLVESARRGKLKSR
jgi:hypothetical protein